MDRRSILQRICRAKDDNKGASLLLVIISVSFVAVIAAVVIVLTYKNLESIRTEMSSTANFYTAETAMDELKTKFDEWSDKAVRRSYSKWLQRLSDTARDDQEKLFKQYFVTEMTGELNTEFMKYFNGSTEDGIDELFATFDSDIRWNEGTVPSIVATADGTGLTVKDISVIYRDIHGYSTTITTDYVFDIAYPGMTVKTVAETNPDCAQYVIIADGQIYNVDNSDSKIYGSLYGGGYNPVDNGGDDKYSLPGIAFKGGNSLIYADRVISKSDIEANDGAQLVFKGRDAEEDYTGELHYSDIWAKGINITGNGVSGMDIQGNCYITDDSTLSAKTDGTNGSSYLNVTGSYYGYNTNNALVGNVDEEGVALTYGTPDGSSSIVINSPNSSVDMTACNPLWLAGKSFVSVPDQYGPNPGYRVSFPQGDSVTYRGLQSAYLLPGECIMGVGHNPITEEEYAKLKEGMAKLPEDREASDYYIDLTRSYSNGGVRLTNYVNINVPYRVAYVTYSADNQDKLVYLYLNFTDSDKAAEYFIEYEGKKDELVNERMSSLGNGRVLFNPETIISTGNCVGYEDTNSGVEPVVYPYNRGYNDPEVEDKQTELVTKYTGLISTLDEDFTGVTNTNFLTDSIVDMSKVSDDTKEEDLSILEGVYDVKHWLITGKDITITQNTSGIIIAKGNVDIASGATFNGLIIARGNVKVNGIYKSEPDVVTYLMLNHEKVIPYFKIGTTEEFGTGEVQATDIIKINYSNWKKN